ncbi:MAG: hypothetical protein JWO86_6795 [Myxococcaceae bacterium]|jgi:hypothetical protein|nr:hypothetical protein [Myxococcaceae bacterium]MEA2752615.1 hypothetical protein [Myxococcales bacterium]
MVRSFPRLGLFALVTLAIASPVVACGSGFIDKLFAGPYDDGGTADVTMDVAPPPDARCALKHSPERPTIPDGANTPTVVFAMDAVSFDEVTAGAPLGFDLDDACTCPEDETCVPPEGGDRRCDRSEGRDNAFGPLFGTIIGQFGSPDFATQRIRDGNYGAIISLSQWNQQPNDPLVTIGFFTSGGLDDPPDAGKSKPRFDGTDRWTIDPESLVSGDQLIGVDCSTSTRCVPLYADLKGYVKDDQLVARIDRVPFVVSTKSGLFEIELTSVILTAHIVREAGILRLERGELVGRSASGRLLAAIGQLQDSVFGSDAGLCNSPGAYALAKSAICDAVDIATAPADDKAGKSCTALSGALGFTAVQAMGGTVFSTARNPNACASFTDSCP